MADDRCTLPGHNPDHDVLVGWDTKQATYYAHVWADDDSLPPHPRGPQAPHLRRSPTSLSWPKS